MLTMIIALLSSWKSAFAQQRTAQRAVRQAVSQLCVLGRHTLARSFLVRQEEGDCSSDYKLHARSPWQAQNLFTPMLEEALRLCPGRFLPLATDDTRLKKTGKKIAAAHWGRDPLSPPFHVNLHYGLRFLHTAVLLPLYQQEDVSARAIPVWFEEVAPVAKPGKTATAAEQQAYRTACAQNNLSARAVAMMRQLRQRVDAAGGRDKLLAFAVDGSYGNKTVLRAALERTLVIARTRKDAKLCFREAAAGRRFYSKQKFTPDEVRQDASRAWQTAQVFHGGQWRAVDYKEVSEVYWQRGAGKRPLRLLVVRPTPYRKTKKGRLLYRQPAFLLTTDLTSAAGELLQIYFDRWQIEVAHRELKQQAGVGEAQVRVAKAVSRQPALSVATYSAVQLAALQVYGAKRPAAFAKLPKYQREKSRLSYQEMLRQVRDEVVSNRLELPFALPITAKSMLATATI